MERFYNNDIIKLQKEIEANKKFICHYNIANEEKEGYDNFVKKILNFETFPYINTEYKNLLIDSFDELDDDEREKILVNLETEDAEEVKELLKYGDETIGSIMSKDFISFNLDITVGEIIDILRESNPEDEELNSIFIKDEEEKVIGVIELKDLILNDSTVKVKEIMDENINILKHNEDIDEAVEIAAKYDLLAIPVVDNNDVLIGVVNTHDLIDEVLYPIWKKKNK